MSRPFRVLVYGDVDLNIIDGSAIWLQSVVRILHRIPRSEITVQLKRNPSRELLTGPLRELDRVRLINQPPNEGRRLLPDRAPRILAELDAEHGPFDAILLRGYRLVLACARDDRLRGRLWCYLTDFPQDPDLLDEPHREELATIAGASRYMLCQTDELRSYLETHIPESRGRTAILRPVIDDMDAEPPPGLGEIPAEGPTIVYAGKFAKRWCTEELVAAVPALRRQVPGARVVAVGDKIHDEPDDEGFAERMRAGLEQTEGVEWLGALPREEVQDVLAAADLGYSVRDPELDASLELSTKLLEYGRAGVPPMLARTPMHERLLGPDYPLFVAQHEDIGARVAEVVARPELYRRAAFAAWSAARRHTLSAAVADLSVLVELACPDPVVSLREPRRVLVVGHDLKFTPLIVDHLSSLPDVEVRLEKWDGINVHDEEASRQNLAWADAILAEWCLGNAVWFGRRRAAGQRLVSRFHLFERDTPYPESLRDGDVDHIAFVGPHILRDMQPRLRLGDDILSIVPNAVATTHLRRPKLPRPRFNLGILGISPWRKRLDLAVETLRLLRLEDDRFTLWVKGHLPIDYWWIWGKERDEYLALMDAANGDPLLAGNIVFDGFGDDVAEWFRKIGHILSPSDFESFHLAAAEGIASGSVPLIWTWEGAAEIYPEERLVTSAEEAAARILDATRNGEAERREREAREAAGEPLLREVLQSWERLLLSPDGSALTP